MKNLFRSGARALAMAFLAAGALMLASVATASAAYSHSTVDTTFPLGAPCVHVYDIAVDESAGAVYVSCGEEERLPLSYTYSVIKKFDLNGNPEPFTASEPYIHGGMLTEDPGAEDGRFDYGSQLAVDNSGSVNHGRLFVTSSPHVEIFEPDGEMVGEVIQSFETSIPNRNNGLDIGPDGSIYVGSPLPDSRVSKYDPGLLEQRRMYTRYQDENEFGELWRIAVDGTGAVWERHESYGNQTPKLTKFESNQFTTELKPHLGVPVPPEAIASPSPFAAAPLLTGGFLGFDVDTTDNELYVDMGDSIAAYSPGEPGEPSYQDAPTFGMGKLTGSEAIAVTKDHHVYASTSSGPAIVKFAPGDILPRIRTFESDQEEVGHHEAVLHGKVEPDGGDPITGCSLEYRAGNANYAEPGTNTIPCTPDPATTPPASNFTVPTEVEAEPTGLESGVTYHYRFTAENQHGKNFGIDRTVVPAFVLAVQTEAAQEVDRDGAQLVGRLNPDGMATGYRFEYGVDTSYGFSTAEEPAGTGTVPIQVSSPLSNLPSGRAFHYRIVATNTFGTTYGQDLVFRTASPPDVAGVRATDLTGTSATLHARVDPVGYATTVSFEYGTSIAYDQIAPASPLSVPAGTQPVELEVQVSGLIPGTRYHFRVVAENKWGSTSSDDTTVDFSPPACPNDAQRQDTGAAYLPDCRAYELVSPGAAGAVLLYPSNTVEEGYSGDWSINSGYATSPSRLIYFGGQGSITGLRPPNAPIDDYLATRTPTGWVTTVPGLKSGQTADSSGLECSVPMDRCIDRNTYPYFLATVGGPETAPYLFDASGEPAGRLPTNMNEVANGARFHGQQLMSPDFSHFIFTSTNVAFSPEGQVSELGSMYDNDLETGSVTVISKLNNGNDIPSEGEASKGIEIGGVSTDGSHVVMEVPAGGGMDHIYMHADGFTFDVSGGSPANFVAMTRNGQSVVFSSLEQLTEDDHDSSADLYLWQQTGSESDSLTRISQGGGQGDSDECSAGWAGSGCPAVAVEPERLHPKSASVPGVRGTDDVMAEDDGAVYFYSPEVLDPTHPGIKNERNLYLYRDGSVRLVTTLDRGTSIQRLQVSPDGANAAFVSDSRVTSYESAGHREMYMYDAETGKLQCASCNPSGAPAVSDVSASQGGRFMSDDGRTFFASKEELVPSDTDGKITDVYEFVDGRPQLITSGLAAKDFTGGSAVITLLVRPAYTGLEAVSHDGQDVYFTSYEHLVSADHNGEFVKVYDARANGGFQEGSAHAPCAAADECHGPDSEEPAPAAVETQQNLGSGNPHHARTGKHAKHRKKRHRRHHHRKHRGRSHAG